jgi:putative spermidine/putrescine transport system substrate-binding protein
VLEDGTIANTNYIAVAYNAANMPAAIVTANFIADPETQYQRVVQLNSLVPVDVTTLDADMAAAYESIELGPAVLGLDVLGPHKLPELSSDWLVAIENGWIENVLQK